MPESPTSKSPTPPDLVNVPKLLNAPVVPLLLRKKPSAVCVKVWPNAFTKIALLFRLKVLPLNVAGLVALLVKVRPSSVITPLMANTEPLMLVAPVPLIVPPLQLNAPFAVSVPVLLSVPLLKLSAPAVVRTALLLRVPPLTVTLPGRLSGPTFKLSAPLACSKLPPNVNALLMLVVVSLRKRPLPATSEPVPESVCVPPTK